MTSPNPIDPSRLVFPPETSARLATQQLADLVANRHRAVHLDLPHVRDYLAPILPGQMCLVIAQTSNFKSGFTRFWQNQLAEQLVREGRDEWIIDVSLEDTVEERAWQELSRLSSLPMRDLITGQVEDWDAVYAAAARVGTTPILRIAYSLADPLSEPVLNVNMILASIEYALQTFGIKQIAAIFLDYIQALAPQPGRSVAGVNDSRRLRVRDDVFALRRLLAYFHTVGIFSVQAKANLDHAYSDKLRLPGVYDGEETAALGQHADRAITMGLPKTWLKAGESFTLGGQSIAVKDNHLLLRVAKQRGNLPAGRVFLLWVDYDTHNISTVAYQ